MAEVITIGKQKIPKNIALAGGAATLGIVAYAYWSRGLGGTTSEDEELVEDQFGDERIPVTVDSSAVQVDTRTGFKTDSEWYNAALEALTLNYGVESTSAAANALNDYLGNRAVTSLEANWLNYVINSIGPPPSGSKPVKLETSTTPTNGQTNRADPGPVRGLTASTSKTQMEAAWSRPNTGGPVKHYNVEFYGGQSGGGSFTTSKHTTTSTRIKSSANLQPNHRYGVRVTPIGTNGRPGKTESITAVTKR